MWPSNPVLPGYRGEKVEPCGLQHVPCSPPLRTDVQERLRPMAGAAPPSSHRQRRAVLRQPCGSCPRRVPQAPPALPRPAGAEQRLEIPAGPFPGEARSSGGFPRPAGKYRTSPLPPGPRPRSPRSAATGTSEGAARPREGAAGAEGDWQPTGTLLLPHEGADSGGAGAAPPSPRDRRSTAGPASTARPHMRPGRRGFPGAAPPLGVSRAGAIPFPRRPPAKHRI